MPLTMDIMLPVSLSASPSLNKLHLMADCLLAFSAFYIVIQMRCCVWSSEYGNTYNCLVKLTSTAKKTGYLLLGEATLHALWQCWNTITKLAFLSMQSRICLKKLSL